MIFLIYGGERMTVNERIKELRKYLHLTQDEFGEKLGIKKSAVSKIEKGENGVTDQMIKLIVKEFGISENWLRNDEGEMFLEFGRVDAITKLATQIITENPNSFKSRFIIFLIPVSYTHLRAHETSV